MLTELPLDLFRLLLRFMHARDQARLMQVSVKTRDFMLECAREHYVACLNTSRWRGFDLKKPRFKGEWALYMGACERIVTGRELKSLSDALYRPDLLSPLMGIRAATVFQLRRALRHRDYVVYMGKLPVKKRRGRNCYTIRRYDDSVIVQNGQRVFRAGFLEIRGGGERVRVVGARAEMDKYLGLEPADVVVERF